MLFSFLNLFCACISEVTLSNAIDMRVSGFRANYFYTFPARGTVFSTRNLVILPNQINKKNGKTQTLQNKAFLLHLRSCKIFIGQFWSPLYNIDNSFELFITLQYCCVLFYLNNIQNIDGGKKSFYGFVSFWLEISFIYN